MLKAALGVVAGYVVMAVMVMITFSAAYLGLGADGAFRPGSYVPSMAWVVVSVVLGLAAALAGGLCCARIAPGTRAPLALAGFVLGLGLLLAVPALVDSRPLEPRGGDVGNFEAMQKARTPGWLAVLNPLVGASGVLLGRRLTREA